MQEGDTFGELEHVLDARERGVRPPAGDAADATPAGHAGGARGRRWHGARGGGGEGAGRERRAGASREVVFMTDRAIVGKR